MIIKYIDDFTKELQNEARNTAITCENLYNFSVLKRPKYANTYIIYSSASKRVTYKYILSVCV